MAERPHEEQRLYGALGAGGVVYRLGTCLRCRIRLISPYTRVSPFKFARHGYGKIFFTHDRFPIMGMRVGLLFQGLQWPSRIPEVTFIPTLAAFMLT